MPHMATVGAPSLRVNASSTLFITKNGPKHHSMRR